MPFTPFHFGPSAAVALPLDKYIDVPVFVLVNVVVDLEPLAVLTLGLNYPLHGYCHTLLIGSLVGFLWGCLAYLLRGIIKPGMRAMLLKYETSFLKATLSGVVGAWLHVLLDALMHKDVMILYPYRVNPLHGLVSVGILHLICLICFIPAFGVYLFKITKVLGRNGRAVKE